jgi:hypothetical protein
MKRTENQEFNPIDEAYLLAHAYVPEHISGMMAAISLAEPFLLDGYVGYIKENWVIIIGYPLEKEFNMVECDRVIKNIKSARQPEYIWFIGPEIPNSLAKDCRDRQSDHYYSLNLVDYSIKSSLHRQVGKAGERLSVEKSRHFTTEHQVLIDELLGNRNLPPMIEELYRSIPDYIKKCETAEVVSARDRHGKLCAFFIIETAAERFDVYLLGCHSKENYIPHASDLVFSEMISLARKRGKPEINLGLGVNPGIQRFKVKWGGVSTLKYEFCEGYFGPPEQLSILDQLLDRNL